MKQPRPESIVARRVAEFVGHTVAIRVTWAPDVDQVGVLVGLSPLGRDYFLELQVAGKKRLIATRAVLELAEVAS